MIGKGRPGLTHTTQTLCPQCLSMVEFVSLSLPSSLSVSLGRSQLLVKRVLLVRETE
jgi:hypothetical protein